MSTVYIIFLVIFILIIAIFAYVGTREGFFRSLNSFLRVALPLLLSGIIVKIVRLISGNIDIISYIIGGIGTVIFYIVFKSVLTRPEKVQKMGLVDYFLGFLVGIATGWLVIGLFVLYIDFFKIIAINGKIISEVFFNAVVTPVKWLLFLEFIKL